MSSRTNFVYLFGGVVIFALITIVIIEAMPRTKPYVPYIPSGPVVGGCAGTRWGCCSDGRTPKADPLGTNCNGISPIIPAKPIIGGCAGTRWGCCPDGHTPKSGPWDTC